MQFVDKDGRLVRSVKSVMAHCSISGCSKWFKVVFKGRCGQQVAKKMTIHRRWRCIIEGSYRRIVGIESWMVGCDFNMQLDRNFWPITWSIEVFDWNFEKRKSVNWPLNFRPFNAIITLKFKGNPKPFNKSTQKIEVYSIKSFTGNSPADDRTLCWSVCSANRSRSPAVHCCPLFRSLHSRCWRTAWTSIRCWPLRRKAVH